MRLSPFRGLRPAPGLASRIPSPPYDVVDDAEARAIVAAEPDSFLRVVRAEVDLAADVDAHDARVYARARDTLRSWVSEGRLVHDPAESFYVYRLEVGNHAQTGVVALSEVDDYVGGAIRRHEFTRPAKEDDRVRHIDVVGAQCGPVLLTYRDEATLDRPIAEIAGRAPDVDFTAPDGVRHTLWVASSEADRSALRRGFDALPCTYIADGHHRAASAARVAADRRARIGTGPWDRFLTVLFPAGAMRVLEYNRLVRDLRGSDRERFLDAVREAGFEIRPDPAARRPARKGTFGMVLAGGAWFSLVPTAPAPAGDPVGGLDVSVLTDRILGPVLGIDDPRTDPRIEFVGGSASAAVLERRIAEGAFAVGFALHPTALLEVLEVADAGRVMPPKSTWFEPKVRSGMVVHDFETP